MISKFSRGIMWTRAIQIGFKTPRYLISITQPSIQTSFNSIKTQQVCCNHMKAFMSPAKYWDLTSEALKIQIKDKI